LNINGLVFFIKANTAFLPCSATCFSATANLPLKLSTPPKYVKYLQFLRCEMWGFHKAPDNEKVHVNYCKRILNVKTSTPNIMVYYELGRYPLIVTRKIRIFKFWMKLLNANNCRLQ
jgi:hypothetical protein